MAGSQITLEVGTDDVRSALVRLARFEGDGLDRAFGVIGEYLVRSTRDRAAREVDPDGVAWRALSPRYRARKAKERPAAKRLRYDSHMLGDQFAHQVVDHELYVGTAAKYGAIHQFGGDIKIAARSQHAYFRQDKRTGALAPRFVKKARSNFARPVTIPEHTITMPARPFLGLSRQDHVEVLAILADQLARQLDGAGGGA
jgi:phage virion morphogenesis protein